MATGSYTQKAVSATRAEQEHAAAHEKNPLSSRTEAVGRELARYGLVVVIAWIGLMKFTALARTPSSSGDYWSRTDGCPQPRRGESRWKSKRELRAMSRKLSRAQS